MEGMLNDLARGAVVMIVFGAVAALAKFEMARFFLSPLYLLERLGPTSSWVRRRDGRVLGAGWTGAMDEARMRFGVLVTWTVAAWFLGAVLPF